MTIPFDPILQDRLTRLHFLARQIVWGMNTGQHRSHRVTRNVEFVEHKVYQPGDPISTIDWKIYARTDRLMIRRQSADTDADCILILDASADMKSTATGKIEDWVESKFGKALTALAALALMVEKRGDPVGLWICGGAKMETGSLGYIPPLQRSLQPIFHRLASVEPTGVADLATHIAQVAMRLRRKSIVVIVSDWMEDPAKWGPQLEILASQGHDIRCLQLYSNTEWNLELPDSIRIFGLETGENLPLDTLAMKHSFREVLQEYRKDVAHWAARARVQWVEASLEDDLLPPLLKLVKGWA